MNLRDLRPGPSPVAPCLDFTPSDRYFALELRAESIEQLSGGDALRRGESERIEAGRSDENADLVAGRDRVRVQGTLAERTSRSVAEQAAHLDTTVDSTSDTWAGQEDTVLLAGHMHDTWNRGTAVVAAMSDDTAAGGGVRTTAPLDLWVHGLMGLEERPGTCTADGVLAEACGTLYEREYRTAVHAAGLAMFNGTLYQSVRNSFRPLMRVSMGVRNLIAAGGGGAAGDAPPASPAPATGGAGAQGAQAAADTLAAGRGAVETSATGTGAVHLDEAAAMTREADVTAVCDVPTELNRSPDTAERLGALQVALRASDTGEPVTSGARASGADAFASAPPTGVLDGQRAAATPGADVPPLHSGDPWARGTEVELGLLGGGPNDSVPPRPEDFDWRFTYREMNAQYGRYRESENPDAVRAYGEAIATIDHKVTQEFDRLRTTVDHLGPRAPGITDTEVMHDALIRMQFRSQRRGRRGAARTTKMDMSLEVIDQLTHEVSARLAARTAEFGPPRPVASAAHSVELFPPVPDRFNWQTTYRELLGQHLRYQAMGNQHAVRACERAIQTIDAKVMAVHLELYGAATPSAPGRVDWAAVEAAYSRFYRVVFQSRPSGGTTSSLVEEFRCRLHAIHRLTHELSADLAARANEFAAIRLAGVEDVARATNPAPPMPQDFRWRIVYRNLSTRFRRFRESGDLIAARAYHRAIQEIDAKVMKTYFDVARRHAALPTRRPPGISVAEDAYTDFHRFVVYAQGGHDQKKRRLDAIENFVQAIDLLTHERSAELTTQFPVTPPPATRPAAILPVAPAPHTVESVSGFAAPARRFVPPTEGPGAPIDPTLHLPQMTPPAFAEPSVGLWPMPAEPGPSSTLTRRVPPLSAAPGGFERTMLDPPVLDPGGATRPSASSGVVATHAADIEVMATPRLGTESTAWARPTATAPGTVAFDTGVQRAGVPWEAPVQGWGPAPTGSGTLGTDSLYDIDMPLFGAIEEAGIPPHASGPSVAPGPADPAPTLPWVEDDFAVERALIGGWLPADFDASALVDLAHRLDPDTPIAAQLQRGELPVQTIDLLIGAHRAADPGGDAAAYTHALQFLRNRIVGALASRYGHRTDPDWLAWVARKFAGGHAGPAAHDPSAFSLGADEIGQLLGESQGSPPPARLESGPAPSRTEAAAGALLPAVTAWSGPPELRDVPLPIHFGAGQAVGTVDATRTTTPRFGRPTSATSGVPFSQHGPIGHRFGADQPSLESGATRFADLPRPIEAVDPTTRAVTPDPEDIDWSMVDELLHLFGGTDHAP